ncbi:hypothetical protein RAS1_14600 [Phycisphaerae bacterium RAS1]|nr:hypothetical protein RAS1_14600 [Phycisphaerae bacterium RAS1]
MSRRVAVARDDVPYLLKQHIEREAELVLAECAETIGAVTAPPIPIDEIVEVHLKLVIEMITMRDLFPFGDVHGAIWMRDQKVGVDTSLDPAVNPRKRGRYHFTLAHEAGHWRLHRKYYLEDVAQGRLFGDDLAKPAYVCRSGDTKPVEWQANQFAANLLMPRKFIYAAWEVWRGNSNVVAVAELRDRSTGAANMTDEDVMEDFCRPLAEQFAVSPEAMRIRLTELELLTKLRSATLF